MRHFEVILFLLEAQCSKRYLKIFLVSDRCIYSPVEMGYSFVSIITVALPTCRILFNSTWTVSVLFVLQMRSSTAFISSVQFQQNVFWQEAVTGHCTICNQRGPATPSGNFCSAKLPFSLSCVIGNVYFVNTSNTDIFSGQWNQIATATLGWDWDPFLSPPLLL